MKKFKKKIFLVPLLLLVLLLCLYGKTAAKYVSDSFWNYYLQSKGFYFSSDYLSNSGIENVNNLWDGGSVEFNVKNNLNTTVISDYDINYTATCSIVGDASSHAECHMNGNSTNEYNGVLSSFQSCVNNTLDQVDVSSMNKSDCEIGGYKWVNQVVKSNLHFDVIVTDSLYELEDVSVEVTVTSTSPYSQTLTGQFILHKNIISEDVSFKYDDYSNYGRLIVSNPSLIDKCVKITWNSERLLIGEDKSIFSSYGVDSNGYINEVKLSIGAKKSNNYIFYKRDFNTQYDSQEFNLTNEQSCM